VLRPAGSFCKSSKSGPASPRRSGALVFGAPEPGTVELIDGSSKPKVRSDGKTGRRAHREPSNQWPVLRCPPRLRRSSAIDPSSPERCHGAARHRSATFCDERERVVPVENLASLKGSGCGCWFVLGRAIEINPTLVAVLRPVGRSLPR